MMIDREIDDFVRYQKQLLQQEFDEQDSPESNKQDGESPQNILRNLEVIDISLGLMGRSVVTLQAISAESPSSPKRTLLPSHRLTVGDDVEIVRKSTKQAHATIPSSRRGDVSGVVSAITDGTISIALYPHSKENIDLDESDHENDDLWDSSPLTVSPKSSIHVHRKMMQALDDLKKYGTGHENAGSVIQAIFGPIVPNTCLINEKMEIKPFNHSLDPSQKSAIEFVLSCENPIALIHGPAGTGKTTTVAELIKQAVLIHKWRVLVTAPSNVAVDNILERLVANDCRNMKNKHKTSATIAAVRLGHPARIRENMLPYSLEYLIQKSEGKEIINDIRNEVEMHFKTLSKRCPKGQYIDKRSLYREVKSLKSEIRVREEKVVREILNSYAQVVLATNVGAASALLDKYTEPFDLVIIDEAAQALEASCWIPILKGRRLVLAGDHCQLPPTIKSSSREVQTGLGSTLFGRMMTKYATKEDFVSRMLQIQYRMNEVISNWASKAMYGGKLLSHDSVRSRRIDDLPSVKMCNNTLIDSSIIFSPMIIIDTAGCERHEAVNQSGSRYNDGEADLVVDHVRTLVAVGVAVEDIAVITPYNGQVFLLREKLHPEYPSLEIRSVDGFQGGEKEAVVLSLVRSSTHCGEDGIGFLKDDRRLNVAITRARRHCCIICDTETINQHAFLKGLVDWVENHGDIVSAIEFAQRAPQSNLEPLKTRTKCGPVRHEVNRKSKVCNAVVNALNDSSNMPNIPNKSSSAEHGNSSYRLNHNLFELDVDLESQLRKKLLTFLESAKDGDEMNFGASLSKFERRLVHQMCEEIGLHHRSEGLDGLDRILIISKNPTIRSDNKVEPILQEESVDISPSRGKVIEVKNMTPDQLVREGDLSSRVKSKPKEQRKDPNLEKDDMAYLDAEILRVQSSHGRRIDGDGKKYLTIVNGVLMSKTKPVDVQTRNSSASIKLNQKLKEAQESRKSKTGKSAKNQNMRN